MSAHAASTANLSRTIDIGLPNCCGKPERPVWCSCTAAFIDADWKFSAGHVVKNVPRLQLCTDGFLRNPAIETGRSTQQDGLTAADSCAVHEGPVRDCHRLRALLRMAQSAPPQVTAYIRTSLWSSSTTKAITAFRPAEMARRPEAISSRRLPFCGVTFSVAMAASISTSFRAAASGPT